MRIFAIIFGLLMTSINGLVKVLLLPFSIFSKSKTDFIFQLNYGHRFCWIDLQFQGSSTTITGLELAHCYLQYLLKVLNVMPEKSVPLVIDCLEKGVNANTGYMIITEEIFAQVLVKSLNDLQRNLVMKVDFPGAVSVKNQESDIQWKHYFKIDKRPSSKVFFNFDSSPTDILFPISCGLFYGYALENLNPLEKQKLNDVILFILNEVKKENSLGVSSYMKLSKYIQKMI